MVSPCRADQNTICANQTCEAGYTFDEKLFACRLLMTGVGPTLQMEGNQITVKYEIEHDLIRTWIMNAFENMFNPVVICVVFMTVIDLATFVLFVFYVYRTYRNQ